MSPDVDPAEFAGKRVLVSGGSKGLGRATVQRFVSGGARVMTAARNALDPIEGVAFVQVDLTTADGGNALAEAAMNRMGGVDVLAHVLGGSAASDLAIVQRTHTSSGPPHGHLGRCTASRPRSRRSHKVAEAAKRRAKGGPRKEPAHRTPG